MERQCIFENMLNLQISELTNLLSNVSISDVYRLKKSFFVIIPFRSQLKLDFRKNL